MLCHFTAIDPVLYNFEVNYEGIVSEIKLVRLLSCLMVIIN